MMDREVRSRRSLHGPVVPVSSGARRRDANLTEGCDDARVDDELNVIAWYAPQRP